MSESSLPSNAADELQFTTAEPGNTPAAGARTGQSCLVCHQPIESTYFALGDKLLCPACCARVHAQPSGTSVGRLAKAALFGLGAGLVGALIWFAVRRIAHLEIGIVAILVGFMVGKAVRVGSGGRGGRGYQILAVVLTYCCIAINYMPDVFAALVDSAEKHRAAEASELDTDPPAQKTANAGTDQSAAKPPHARAKRSASIGSWILLFVFLFAFSLAAPFLAGLQNIIGLLIIGFALWEAWKFNIHHPLPISGPYQIGPSPAR